MSKPYNTRSTEAGDASQEDTPGNTETSTTATNVSSQPVDMAAIAQMLASLKADNAHMLDSIKIDNANNAIMLDSIKTDNANNAQMLDSIKSDNDKIAAQIDSHATMLDSIKTSNDSNATYLKSEIASLSTNFDKTSAEIAIKHSNEISNIRTELTSEFKIFSDNIKSEIVRIDNSIQQQREDFLQSLNVHRQQLHEEQEASFQKQKDENQSALDQLHNRLSDKLDNSERTTDHKIKQKFDEASLIINASREETFSKIADLRYDQQQSIDVLTITVEKQKTEHNLLCNDIDSNKKQTEANSKQISNLKEENKQITTKISDETHERYRSIEELKHAEEERMAKLEKELQKIKQASINQSSCSANRSLVRPDMIPKFSGNRDRLHPMTYLRSVTYLSEEILDEKNLLNIIRLTLTDRALEWFELVSAKCKTFEQFVEFFKKQYWSENQQDRLKINLLTGHYKEGLVSRENYAIDAFNKCKDIDSLTEKEVSKHLLKHFELTDNSVTLCTEPQTINELIDILRKLDDLSELQKKNRLAQNNYSRNSDVRQNYPQYRPPAPRYADNNPPSRGGFGNRNNGNRPSYGNGNNGNRPSYGNNGNYNGNRSGYQGNYYNDNRNVNNIRVNRPSRSSSPRIIQGRGSSEERVPTPEERNVTNIQKKTPILQVYDNPLPGTSHMTN